MENNKKIIVADADYQPLAPVPPGIVLSEAEQAALSRMMEYTRKGSMPSVMITRQQWVEDFLNRGFTQLELFKHGRAPARLRITAPARKGRGGRPQFYEVQSAIEIAYVQRRYKELHEVKVEKNVATDVAPLPGLESSRLSKVDRRHTERFTDSQSAEQFVLVNGLAQKGAQVVGLADGRAEVVFSWALEGGPRPAQASWYLLADGRPYHGFYEEAKGVDSAARGPFKAESLAEMLGTTPDNLPRLSLGLTEAEPAVDADPLAQLTATIKGYYEAEEPSHPWDGMAAKMAGYIHDLDADTLRSLLGHGRGFNDSSKAVFFRHYLKQPVPSNIKAIHEAIDKWAGVSAEERARRDAVASEAREIRLAREEVKRAAMWVSRLDVTLPDGSKQNAKDWIDGCFNQGFNRVYLATVEGESKRPSNFLGNAAGRGWPLKRRELADYAKACVKLLNLEHPAVSEMTPAEPTATESQIEATPEVKQVAAAEPSSPVANPLEVLREGLGDRFQLVSVGDPKPELKPFAERQEQQDAHMDAELARVELAPALAWIERTFGAGVFNRANRLSMAKYLVGEASSYQGITNWKWEGGLKALGLWERGDTKVTLADLAKGIRKAFENGVVVSPEPLEDPWQAPVQEAKPDQEQRRTVRRPDDAIVDVVTGEEVDDSLSTEEWEEYRRRQEIEAAESRKPVVPTASAEKPFAFMYDDAAEAEVYSDEARARFLKNYERMDENEQREGGFSADTALRTMLRRQGFPEEAIKARPAESGPQMIQARAKAGSFVLLGGRNLVSLANPQAWPNGPARSATALGALIAALERPSSDMWADEVWRKVVEARGTSFRQDRPSGRALRDFMRAWVGEANWATFLKCRAMKMDEDKAKADLRDAMPDDPLARDWSYERDQKITPNGDITRIRANIDAIRIVKKLEAEGGRLATAEEREKLAKFNGWGGLKFVFEDAPYAVTGLRELHGAKWPEATRQAQEAKKAEFLRQNGYERSWKTAEEEALDWYQKTGRFSEELRSILSEDEFNATALSILNAHYTEESICHSLWDIARRAGFSGGRVLEPACGSGRILGAMPPELRAKCRVDAVELEPISAAITAALFPQTKVHACGFEEAILPVGAYDLVITNVPFHAVGPGVQEGLGDVPFNLHNYFIAESMRKLKPGGVAVIITSASTMEKNDAQRAALAKLGELHGAIRLPADAFKGNAGTEVVTDILLMRKRGERLLPSEEDMTAISMVDLPEDQQATDAKGKPVTFTTINGYFARNPEQVLGFHSLKGKMYGAHGNRGGQYTVLSPENAPPIEARLADAIARLPRAIMAKSPDHSINAVEAEDILMRQPTELPGSLVRRSRKEPDGREVTTVYIVPPSGELLETPWELSGDAPEGSKTPAIATKRANLFLDLRDALLAQVAADLSGNTTDEQSAEARKRLKAAYERYVAEFGTLNDSRKALRALAPQDSTMGSVMALERVVELPRVPGKRARFEVIPMPIFTQRTLFPDVQPGRPENIEDAVSQSINQTGGIDLNYIAEALGREDREAVAEEILTAGLGFRDHTCPANLVPKAAYLSGDVVSKLEACRRAILSDSRLQTSLSALEAVQPKPVVWDRIQAGLTFGETWTPPHLFTRFLNETYGTNLAREPIYEPKTHKWSWGELERAHSPSAQSKIGTKRASWSSIVMDALAKRPSSIYDKVEGDKRILNAEATEELRQRCVMIDTDFQQWSGKHADVKQELSDRFNAVFNRMVPFADTGDKLSFPGLATGPGALVPREYQRKAVARFLQEPAGMAAHGTGFGKTFTAILTAHEHRRLGLSRKPMMVCDSANYVQFVQAYRTAYPQDNILVADDANFSPAERENFKAQVAFGDYDCVLMSRTQFEKIPVSVQTEEAWETEELRALRDAAESADADTPSARKAQDALYRKEQQIAKRLDGLRKIRDRGLTWEQLGVDLLIVDECHRHKKTGFATEFADVKGIDAGESRRGRDLLMKARYIQDRRGGRGCIGLSGTPATNTMAEFWTMNRIFAPNTLTQFGMEHFDDFMTALCDVEKRLEMNEANGKHRYVDRLCKFRKVGVLREFVQAGADVQLDASKLNLKLPAHVSGNVELDVVPVTDAVLDEMDKLAMYYEVFEQATGKEKRELSWVPITLMQLGMAASIDPRLVDPTAPDDEGSLVNRLTGNVAAIYHETAEDRKTQCIFLDRYRGVNTSILRRLGGGGGKLTASDLIQAVELDDSPAEAEADQSDLDDLEAAPSQGGDEPTGDDGRFNLYEDIKAKLVAKGVKPEEIAFIGEAKNATERAALFARVNAGTIRVLIGSSDKMGIGANFQERLYAAHNFDPPRNMTPDQQEQRDGRIIRSGNTNEAVRVIMYGMQDTVTPAVINRIQTKRQFIRAGFFGEGDEMEDLGDVRLDEFQAALVPDKRQLKLADLNGQIKDCHLAINVALNRISNFESSVRSLTTRLDWLRGKKLFDARRAADWIKDNVQPIHSDGEITIDLSGMHKEIANSTTAPEAAKAWFAKEWEGGAPMILKGKYSEVEKTLGKLIDALKTAKLDFGHEKTQLGTVKVNGLTVRVIYAQYETASGNRGEGLLASVLNPTGMSSEDNAYFARHVKFASPMMFLSVVGNVPGQVEGQVRGTEMEISQTENELEIIRAELAVAPQPVEARTKLAALEAELKALKEDMVKNPFVRGANRRKKQAETEATAIGTEAHVTGAIERGESEAIAGVEATPAERPASSVGSRAISISPGVNPNEFQIRDGETLLGYFVMQGGQVGRTNYAYPDQRKDDIDAAVAAFAAGRERMAGKIGANSDGASAMPPVASVNGERLVGKNMNAQAVFEDANGRRSVAEEPGGLRSRRGEKMRMGYDADKKPVWTPAPRAGTEFETADEAAARVRELARDRELAKASRFERARAHNGDNATVANIIRDIVLARPDVRAAIEQTPQNAVLAIEAAVDDEVVELADEIRNWQGLDGLKTSWLASFNRYNRVDLAERAQGILDHAKRAEVEATQGASTPHRAGR